MYHDKYGILPQTSNYQPEMTDNLRVHTNTFSKEDLLRFRDAGIWVMHPGPVNRGVELGDAVMTYERTLINQQVENGIAVRMAVLYWLKPETN